MLVAAADCCRAGWGDVLNQVRQVVRHLFNLTEGQTGVLGEACAGDHFRGGLLHRAHRFVGVGLNRLHQRFDTFRGVGSAFCQSLHFVGHDRESATRLTGGCRLNGGVQRENVGLFGDVVDQFDDDPISCDDSPRRLIRFEVSWIWSRMLSMP